MKEFTVAMACFDYIPVLLFTFSATILIEDMYNRMDKKAFALFSGGMLCVISAGLMKATYKLLYALGICNFTSLNAAFFPLQSLGFMFTGLGVLIMLSGRRRKPDARGRKRRKTVLILSICGIYVLAGAFLLLKNHPEGNKVPEPFSGTFVFVALMMLGLAILTAGLAVISAESGKKSLIAFFLGSFILYLFMGFLSSRNFRLSSTNWMAECVNTISQILFLIGATKLDKERKESDLSSSQEA